MKAGLPMARWMVQRASRASAWGSALSLRDPAVLFTYCPLSESLFPFAFKYCSAVRVFDGSTVPSACCQLSRASSLSLSLSLPPVVARGSVPLLAAGCQLPPATCSSSPASCLLPAARCSCLPPPARCQLPAGPRLGARDIPTRSSGRTRSSISGYDFATFPPAALIAKN